MGPWEKYGTPQPSSPSGPWAKYVPAGENPQKPADVGYAGDIAASGASGLARGTADLIGLPGSIADAMNSGGQWALRKGYQAVTGEEPKPGTFFGGPTPEAAQTNPLSSAKLRSSLSVVTGGTSDYQPKTVPGEYTRTLGEFAPSAIALGGTSLSAVFGNLIAPAVTSETAGQITKGTGLEPYARVAGALAGGMAGSALSKPEAAQLPSAADIKASAGYADLKGPMKAAQIDKPTYQGIVQDLWNEANDFGLTTKLKGEVGGTLNDFAKRANAGGASLYDLEVLRRSLRNIGGDKLDQSAQALSGRLIDKLDQSVENLSAANIAAAGETGTPTLEALQNARETYRTGIKAQMIENAIEKGQNAASGVENGTRNSFRELLKPQNAKNFTEPELDAIKSVANGTATTNTLRFLGTFGFPIDQGRNWLGALAGSSAAGSMAGSAFGPGVGTIIGAGTALGGTAAKYAASKATQNHAALVEALVKAGPQAGEMLNQAASASSTAGKEALLRALLQSQSAVHVPPSKVPLRQ